MGGCLVRGPQTRGMGNTADGDLDAWPSSLQKLLLAYPDMEIVIPGHGDPGNAELIERTIEMARQHPPR